MGYIRNEERFPGVRHFLKAFPVPDAGIVGGAGHYKFGALFFHELFGFFVVKQLGLLVDVHGDYLEIAAGKVEGVAVREVAAVRKVQAHYFIAGIDEREVSRDICLGSRVRLDIGVLRAEKFLGAVDSELFSYIYVFAAAVVAFSGVAFGVFICEDGTEGFHDGPGGVVLGGDKLQIVLLAQDFAFNGFVKLGIVFANLVVHGVLLCRR